MNVNSYCASLGEASVPASAHGDVVESFECKAEYRFLLHTYFLKHIWDRKYNLVPYRFCINLANVYSCIIFFNTSNDEVTVVSLVFC